MYIDNVQFLCFKASIDNVKNVLDRINSIKSDAEIIQLFNADFIVSKKHIIHGIYQAFLAFKRNENLANDFGVEIVLRCSAQRQISKAFDLLGLKEGNMNLYVVLINSKDYTKELSSFFNLYDDVYNPDLNRLIDAYKISALELETFSVEDIIIDRITKLTVDY